MGQISMEIISPPGSTLSGNQQQDIGRKTAVIENTAIIKPGGGAFASGCNHHRQKRHRIGRVLPQIVSTSRKGEGGHGNRTKDRRAVLQQPATRHGVSRPGRHPIRGTVSQSGRRKPETQGPDLRLCPAGITTGLRHGCFLGRPRSSLRASGCEVRVRGELASCMAGRDDLPSDARQSARLSLMAHATGQPAYAHG